VPRCRRARSTDVVLARQIALVLAACLWSQ
jgi:hypothetical protein